jgi:hypothetical protein
MNVDSFGQGNNAFVKNISDLHCSKCRIVLAPNINIAIIMPLVKVAVFLALLKSWDINH